MVQETHRNLRVMDPMCRGLHRNLDVISICTVYIYQIVNIYVCTYIYVYIHIHIYIYSYT